MTNSPVFPETIQGVRDFIRTIPTDTGKLQFVLGLREYPKAPRMAYDIVVNSLDTENYEWDQSKLMEVGINAFTSTDLRQHVNDPGPNAEKMLKQIYHYHLRIKANAHLKNTKFCQGDPEANRFGNTRFTDKDETKAMLTDCFSWARNSDRPQDGLCPTILLGHAVQNDTDGPHGLESTLDFDPHATGTVVATLDTQSMAHEMGIHNPANIRNPISLKHLCGHFGIPYRDAHTAGNDAAYTTVAAIYMAVYGRNAPAFPKTVEKSIDEVEIVSRKTGVTTFGVPKYCSKCHSTNHLRRHCRTRLDPCHKCQSYRTPAQVAKDQVFHHTAGWKAHYPEDCTWNVRGR